jgi:hypothetical protein
MVVENRDLAVHFALTHIGEVVAFAHQDRFCPKRLR